jgi:hypothetical protein
MQQQKQQPQQQWRLGVVLLLLLLVVVARQSRPVRWANAVSATAGGCKAAAGIQPACGAAALPHNNA